ncbi:hypothetical protein M406DRAFT_71512 [Cryphonectria parasitica EP155]|uniref:NADP-dependent oxidoreductase domain-containing protein n=1 Tax=Cryphonectria parasitica (strain ATCC 38755 / EP155) TaxID=660469 RepID=A0A9P5CSM9_CRYP1|nr:uncharacterized protein M406DRAFT_71512 [Cryphonectria parasitica EP155]KAF3768516.1 hypothetical protein M406DRAFT_71512 [Cryphonectria parasitica EP155]
MSCLESILCGLTGGPKPFPKFPLQTGAMIPAVGFGTGSTWAKPERGRVNPELIHMIKTAILSGFTHIDTSRSYFTEEEVGMAIKESGVPRNKLFLTTKLPCPIEDPEEYIKDSLRRLKTPYVDLFSFINARTDISLRALIESPYFTDDFSHLQTAWRYMEFIFNSGRAKAIGVSNFLRQHVEAILDIAKVPPTVNQIEFHPYLQRSDDYVKWMQSRGITVCAHHPLAPITAGAGGPLDPVLDKISKAHSVSVTAVLLKWQIELEIVAITTTETEERLKEYLQAAQFELTDAEVQEISSVGKTAHLRTWDLGRFSMDDRT